MKKNPILNNITGDFKRPGIIRVMYIKAIAISEIWKGKKVLVSTDRKFYVSDIPGPVFLRMARDLGKKMKRETKWNRIIQPVLRGWKAI